MDVAALAEQIGRYAQARGLKVAVAESLTGGQLSAALAKATDASEWFRGGVVAYSTEVKHDLLDVRPGPVVSEEAATDLARGAARVLDADVGLGTTGVGGPGPQDGVPAGRG